MQPDQILTPFAPMEQSQQGYEAHYHYSDRLEVTQYHCHDYYELYIHLHGGEYMGVDNQLFSLKPNQVFILPPFCMHGLSCTDEMHDYEEESIYIGKDIRFDVCAECYTELAQLVKNFLNKRDKQ